MSGVFARSLCECVVVLGGMDCTKHRNWLLCMSFDKIKLIGNLTEHRSLFQLFSSSRTRQAIVAAVPFIGGNPLVDVLLLADLFFRDDEAEDAPSTESGGKPCTYSTDHK